MAKRWANCTSSCDCDQLGSKKMLIVIPHAGIAPLPERGLLHARIGRIEHEQCRTLKMGGGQAVGDEDDLPVGGVGGRRQLPALLQGVLNVREVAGCNIR